MAVSDPFSAPVLEAEPKPVGVPKPVDDMRTKHDHSSVLSNEMTGGFMAPNIAGSRWYGTYYRQILGDADEPSPYSDDLSNAQQMYDSIDKLFLMVEGRASFTDNAQQGTQSLTRECVVVGGIIPNYGDCFIGDMGDGKAGYFNVKTTTRPTHYSNTTYTVELEFIRYMDDELEERFKRKTVKDLSFSVERFEKGLNGLVTTQRYDHLKKIESILRHANDTMGRKFYDKKAKSLVYVDSDGKKTYDNDLVGFYKKVVGVIYSNSDIVHYDLELFVKTNPVSLYGHILNPLGCPLDLVCTTPATWEVQSLRNQDPRLISMVFSGIAKVVYNDDGNTDALVELEADSATLFYNTTGHKNYVLSEFFYKGERDKMSVLERAITDAVNNSYSDVEEAVKLYDAVLRTPLGSNRYYLYPLVCWLMSTAARSAM